MCGKCCSFVSELYHQQIFLSPLGGEDRSCLGTVSDVSIVPQEDTRMIASLFILFIVQGWPVTEFATALAITIGYLVFALAGPILMARSPPIDSYPVRFVYNIIQVRTVS